MATQPVEQKDPIVYGSLNWHITIASILLGLSLVWALYDEIYAKRPWKGYQKDFVTRYESFLDGELAERRKVEQSLLKDADLQALQAQMDQAAEEAKGPIAAIDAELNDTVTPRIGKLTKAMQVVRSEVMALTYKLQHTEGAEKEALAKELEEVKARKTPVVDVPSLEKKGETENLSLDYYTLGHDLDAAKAIKSEMFRKRAELDTPKRELQAKYDKLAARKREGLSSQQIAGLIQKAENFRIDIKQINVPEYGLVDRCESCHLGTREPIDIGPDTLGGPHSRVYVSHPDAELLKIHDPEKFGCTPCHNGNGAATISAKEGHGRIKHWLYPMYELENVEAGCLQCHEGDLNLRLATTLNEGKELFRFRGCWGCHPRDGFDVERSQIRQTALALKSVEGTVDRKKWEIQKQINIADDINSTDEQVTAALAEIPKYTLEISTLESQQIELQRREAALRKQAKNVGPSLRPIKSKLKPGWIPVWITNPRGFRPTTRMPVFRLSEDQVHAVAAAVWQAADEPSDVKHSRGDAAHGKELFQSRGCQACHSAEKNAEGQWFGNVWGPELSHVGQKAKYDYLVEWIHDTPDWSLMPNLRLTIEEAQDLATYLVGLSEPKPEYEAKPDFLEDRELAATGAALIRHFGCSGCHDIAGFENAGKIGTDLTTEGNKPIERLDFGLYTYASKRGIQPDGTHGEEWYDHKSFFTHKLQKPEFFDHGKTFETPLERARMPNFGLSESETTALVTFLLGSVDSGLPEAMFYNPRDFKRKSIREGWWVIKKYNCEGCHQILPGQTPLIRTLPQYQGENVVLTPPSLVGVGARLNPEWLAKFLRNPAMSDHNIHRNGVRSYLQIRMPTFNLWDEEIGALVAFFEAMADQTLPYFPPKYEEMTPDELTLARSAFLNADCLNCHASEDEATPDPSIVAPSFVHASDRLKISWVERWLSDPGKLQPGTKMPAGLFRWVPDEKRWVVAGQQSDELKAYPNDERRLFARYISLIDPNEAKALRDIYSTKKPEKGQEEEEFFDEDE